MDHKERSKNPGNVKVNIVDRRHHASAGTQTQAPDAERSPYPSVVREMEARAAAAEQKAREKIAHAEAEIDAVRERLTRDVERRVLEGRSRLLTRILDVVDNLERAAETAREESEKVVEGIELILRQVLTILSTEGVEPIETVGQEFDPTVAEAIGIEPAEPDNHNVVVREVRRGYRLGETILRPARVIIGRAAD